MNNLILTTLFTINVLIMAFAFSGCGTDDSAGASSDSAEEKALNDENTASHQSIAVELFSDLPACEEAIAKQLAYVKADEQFYVCEALSWAAIEIKGDKGDKGDAGATGATGSAGVGTNTANTWLDATTGKTWIIGGKGDWNKQNCGSSYHAPTFEETAEGVAHGILTVSISLGGANTMWSTYETAGNGVYRDSNGSYAQAAKTTDHGLFCIKN